MFCNKCGKEFLDGTKFCSGCGTALGTDIKVQPNSNSAPTPAHKSKRKKIGAIVIIALGGLSVLGSFANDYYWNIAHNGLNLSDFITIGIQIGLIAVGAYLIYKSKNN